MANMATIRSPFGFVNKSSWNTAAQFSKLTTAHKENNIHAERVMKSSTKHFLSQLSFTDSLFFSPPALIACAPARDFASSRSCSLRI